MCISSIAKLGKMDMEDREEFWKNIVVSGGGAQFPQMADKLRLALTEDARRRRVRLPPPTNVTAVGANAVWETASRAVATGAWFDGMRWGRDQYERHLDGDGSPPLEWGV
jgi:actin-related protein